MGFFANLAKEFKQRNYIKGYDWAAGRVARRNNRPRQRSGLIDGLGG